MEPVPDDHAGPAVEVHGRAVTATPRAASWYRQAQRAADAGRATAALRLAAAADPGFGLAAADLGAIAGTPGHDTGGRLTTWERHHVEVVRTAAAGQPARAADLLREHLAGVGCDPLAFRIAAWLRPAGPDAGLEDLAGRLPGCHATRWPGDRPRLSGPGLGIRVAVHILTGSPPLPGFLSALSGPLGHYGYWAVFVLVLLEDFGIPVPGETVLIAAAVYAGHGQLNVVAVGTIAFAAAVLGDNIGFAIGHFGGRTLALRWGRYVFLTEERLDRAESFFNRHGGKIIVVARFIEGLRQANGIIAGISGMRWPRFSVFNALGAALWVGTWVSLGYLAGDHIGAIYGYITRYSYYALITAAVLLAGYLTRRLLRRRRHAAGQASTSGTDLW